ncbi:MAG: tRNA (adenosine(37)-N6)-threonylcarbamoyltransferase complex transferase subunit TsaD [Patescibacteria group bacterium]
MIILGIETSCDETALCLLEVNDKEEYKVLGNIVLSQIKIHEQYGGVFPMVAKREHAKHLVPLLEQLMKESDIPTTDVSNPNASEVVTGLLQEFESDLLGNLLSSSLVSKQPIIDRIAVTHGPGLEPTLWVGVNFAKALHMTWNVPVVTVNHMEGHILSPLVEPRTDQSIHEFKKLPQIPLPALSLLISGGHTELVSIEAVGSYSIIGSTRDDAVGEAFDKVARMLGLPYPGGPQVSMLAMKARKENLPNVIDLPRPMIASKDFDFSFSGLKTSVLYALKELPSPLPEASMAALCREFEDAVTDVLVSKTKKALDKHVPKSLIIGGGVIANMHIRQSFEKLAKEFGIPLLLPHNHLTGDNALMIALAGYYSKVATNISDIKATGNLSL